MARTVLDKGDKFGKWTVEREVEPIIVGTNTYDRYECVCECGTVRTVRKNLLVKAQSRSCGCTVRGARPTEFPPDIEGARWIPLTKGKFALVDEQDYEPLSKYFWCYTRQGYAEATQRKLYDINRIMHRNMFPPTELEVDHINGDKLDNRRANLRLATREQNSKNLRPQKGRKYKGVYYRKKFDNWVASISLDKKLIYLGVFNTDDDAARAYNEAAKRMHGEFAWLNPVPEKPVKTDTSPVSPNNEVSSS